MDNRTFLNGVCRIIILLLLISSCAPVISKDVRDQVAPGVTFKDVLEDPDAYVGKTVLWAGVILKAENDNEGTLLEVMQTPTAFRGKPGSIGWSKGSFMALANGSHLDSTIYTKDKGVTIAGEVQGKQAQRLLLDEGQLGYPLILVKEIHPWPRDDRDSIDSAQDFWSPWSFPGF